MRGVFITTVEGVDLARERVFIVMKRMAEDGRGSQLLLFLRSRAISEVA